MSGSAARLFVAVDIPEAARESVAAAAAELRGEAPHARWVRPENLHLTLKFIGAYPEERLEGLARELRECGASCSPFLAVLGECGAFPSPRRARVLWLGLWQGGEGAAAVAGKVEARLERLGVQRETRRYKGHITLARMRRPGDCEDMVQRLSSRLEALRSAPFAVDEMVLYRSILRAQGPQYVALERVPLGG